MSRIRVEQGKRGEAVARALLRREGMRIETANVRFPVGELDLVAWDRGTLCFVEVRSRSSVEFGGPLESVTRRKQQRMIRAAQWYLKRRALNPEAIRFDIISIVWQPSGHPAVELVRGAFGAE